MRLSLVATSLVTLVVAVMVIALVAVPVIEDAAKGTPYVGQNSGYDVAYEYVESSPTFTITNNNGTISVTYGDKTETVTTDPYWPVVLSNDITVRIRSDGITTYDLANSRFSALNSLATSWSMVVTSGSYTITTGSSTTYTGTIEGPCFFQWNHGKFGGFDGQPKIGLSDKYYLAHFFGSADGPFRMYEATAGTLGSAFIEMWIASGSTIVSGYTVTADIDWNVIGGNQAVGVVDGVNWTWNNGGTPGTSSAYQTIASIEYESTPTGTGDDTNSILLSIIPVMLIIVAIMIAVRLVRDA